MFVIRDGPDAFPYLEFQKVPDEPWHYLAPQFLAYSLTPWLVYKDVVELHVISQNTFKLQSDMSVFFYEPFYDLERFADILFPSEGQKHGHQLQVRGAEGGVRSYKPR